MNSFIEFLKIISGIIKVSSRSRLATLSLMVLLISFLAYDFFSNEESLIKSGIFIILFLGIILYGFVVLNPKKRNRKNIRPSNSIIENNNARKIKIYSLVIAIGLFVFLLIFYNLFILNRPLYFKDFYRTRYGWIGKNKLSNQFSQHRNRYFRFNYHGWLGSLVSVEYLNGSGGFIRDDFPDMFGTILIRECADVRAVKVIFDYSTEGNLISESFHDQTDRVLVNMRYTNSARTVKFEYESGASCSRTKTNVRAVEIDYVIDGANKDRIELIKYKNDVLASVPDENHNFGIYYKYDEHGNILRIDSIDNNNKPHKIGTEFNYDLQGNLIQETYWTQDNKKAFKEGISKKINGYDEYGNIINQAYFDDIEKPTFGKDGISILKFKYDSHGNMIYKSYNDDSGNITLNSKGYSFQIIGYDDQGQPIENRFFDSQGKPTFVSRRGFSVVKTQYDEAQRIIKKQFFDEVGRPILCDHGYHMTQYVYDKYGNLAEIQFKDTTNQLIRGDSGIAVLVNKFDSNGLRIESNYLDENRNRTYITPSKTGIDRANYNDIGQRVEFASFDIFEKPIFDVELMFHKCIKSYNEFGLVSTETYLDQNNKLVSNHFAISKAEYDVLGRKTKVKMYIDSTSKSYLHEYYYNDFDQLVKEVFRGNWYPEKEFDIVKYEYDLLGRKVRWSYFDSLDNPVIIKKESYSTWKAMYDRTGNAIEIKKLDQYGNGIEGVAITRQKFDAKGYLIEISYYDKIGTPIANNDGVTIYSIENDRYGRATSGSCFDKNRKRVLNVQGLHKLERTFNKNGNIVSERYYDTLLNLTALKGESYAGSKSRFDAQGNWLETIFFDKNLEPIHYAIRRASYDERGFQLFRSFHNKDGKLMMNEAGIAYIKQVWNEFQLKEKYYYDTEMKPVNSIDNFHKTTYSYDRWGNANEKHFDLSGKLVK